MSERQRKPTGMPGKYKRLYGPVATVFASAHTGSWRIKRPAVRQEDCVGCGVCEANCPAQVIELKPGRQGKDEGKDKGPKRSQDRRGETVVVIDWDYCKGCGICARLCAVGCIEMVEEPANEAY